MSGNTRFKFRVANNYSFWAESNSAKTRRVAERTCSSFGCNMKGFDDRDTSVSGMSGFYVTFTTSKPVDGPRFVRAFQENCRGVISWGINGGEICLADDFRPNVLHAMATIAQGSMILDLGPKLLTPQFQDSISRLLGQPGQSDPSIVRRNGDFLQLLQREVKGYAAVGGALFNCPAKLIPILVQKDAKVVHYNITGNISAAHQAILQQIGSLGFTIARESYTNPQSISAYQGLDRIAARVLVGIAAAKCSYPDANPTGIHDLFGRSAAEQNEQTLGFKTYDGKQIPAGYEVTIRLCRAVYQLQQHRTLWWSSTTESSSVAMSTAVYIIPTAMVDSFNQSAHAQAVLRALE